ncbi:unnamed protein product [Ixodes persulcatus]
MPYTVMMIAVKVVRLNFEEVSFSFTESTLCLPREDVLLLLAQRRDPILLSRGKGLV